MSTLAPTVARSTVSPSPQPDTLAVQATQQPTARPVFIATARPAAPAATPSAPRALPPTTTPVPGRPPVQVVARDDEFVPAYVEVLPGTLVRWVNRGVNDHDVVADDGSFESPVFRPGQLVEVVFGAPGSFAYVCTLHEDMIGVVEVR